MNARGVGKLYMNWLSHEDCKQYKRRIFNNVILKAENCMNENISGWKGDLCCTFWYNFSFYFLMMLMYFFGNYVKFIDSENLYSLEFNFIVARDHNFNDDYLSPENVTKTYG